MPLIFVSEELQGSSEKYDLESGVLLRNDETVISRPSDGFAKLLDRLGLCKGTSSRSLMKKLLPHLIHVIISLSVLEIRAHVSWVIALWDVLVALVAGKCSSLKPK